MGIVARVRLVDEQGRTASLGLVFPTAVTTIAAAQTAFNTWQPLFEAISGMGVRSAEISAKLTLTPSAAKAGSNRDEGAWLTMTDTEGDNFSVRIPAPSRTAGVYDYIVGGEVDLTNTDIQDYAAQFEAAGSIRFGAKSYRVSAGLESGYLEK